MIAYNGRAEEFPIFVLRSIQSAEDTVETMVMEDQRKRLERMCENCHRDLRCTFQRKFVTHPEGFVVTINRGKWIPQLDAKKNPRLDADGNPMMVKVSFHY